MLYAEVIVDITAEALDRPFSYIIPEELEKDIADGSRENEDCIRRRHR